VTILVDTNVLLRQLEPQHAHHQAAVDATMRLLGSGEPMHVTPQVIAEFWSAATRPGQNGLGLDPDTVAGAIDRVEETFTLLPDDPAIHEHWKQLVKTHRVIGNRAFDARLVAVMLVHKIERILTFNTEDFVRYRVAVLDPATV
jgi:predicted nucleic acid-binding protein